jgi:hypothetical protein
MIERYLAEVDGRLRVHGRRRRRILAELRAHLEECAAAHGEAEAVRRMGTPLLVAASFTPRPADRLVEGRDRLAALVMLGAMAASLPLAATLTRLGGDQGSRAWIWFLALLAPTAAVALASCIGVLAGRGWGARLAPVLLVMVAVTALVVLADLPPAHAEFASYQAAVRAGQETAGCDGRTLGACAADHAGEIRTFYSLGATALAAGYLWAVSGWMPGRRSRQRAAA